MKIIEIIELIRNANRHAVLEDLELMLIDLAVEDSFINVSIEEVKKYIKENI